jgi:ceramide glucosyltransferase
MIEGVLIGLASISILLCIWQWIAARRFPLREPRQIDSPVPLSVLKPLKGADAETEACLRSWFEQEYSGPVELLFGIADEDDPAGVLARKLAAHYPGRRSQLVLCHPVLGPNAKVSSLCYLAREAAFEHLVISDDDVEIPRGFLEQLVEPFSRGVALVNAVYILRPLNFPMALEAVAVNADFWTQVLQGNTLKQMDFGLGAVMATTKAELARIGGLENLLSHLADDFQLGNRIARAGGKLELCTVPVTCWSGEQSAWKVWQHQLRWARTIRFCKPFPYFMSILSNGTLWPLLAWLATPNWGTAVLAQAGILVRMLSAKSNYRKLTGDNGWLAFGLAPLKDLLGTIVWALAFAGNTVNWRGLRYRVSRGGKLTPLA